MTWAVDFLWVLNSRRCLASLPLSASPQNLSKQSQKSAEFTGNLQPRLVHSVTASASEISDKGSILIECLSLEGKNLLQHLSIWRTGGHSKGNPITYLSLLLYELGNHLKLCIRKLFWTSAGTAMKFLRPLFSAEENLRLSISSEAKNVQDDSYFFIWNCSVCRHFTNLANLAKNFRN